MSDRVKHRVTGQLGWIIGMGSTIYRVKVNWDNGMSSQVAIRELIRIKEGEEDGQGQGNGAT